MSRMAIRDCNSYWNNTVISEINSVDMSYSLGNELQKLPLISRIKEGL